VIGLLHLKTAFKTLLNIRIDYKHQPKDSLAKKHSSKNMCSI